MAVILRFRRIKEIKKLRQHHDNELIKRVIKRRHEIGLLTDAEARCLIEMYAYRAA